MSGAANGFRKATNGEEEMERQRLLRCPGALILGAVILTGLSFLVHEIYSVDVWWQVRIGADIISSGHVPRVDRYSAAGAGRPYHDSHWLFQVVLASAHWVAGMAGVEAAMIVLWAAILLFCFLAIRRWVSLPVAAVLLFLAMMASVERFLPRPELVTLLGITSFYWLLQEGRYRSWRGLTAFGLVQMLWANGHGFFVIGPFMVGCYWLFAGVGRRRGPELSRLTLLLGPVLGSSLLTPYGLGSWRFALLLLAEAAGGDGPEVLKTLGELSPTFGAAARSGLAFWFFFMLLVASVGLGGIAGVVRRSASPRLLIVVGMFLVALSGRRAMVFFAVVAAPFVAESLAALGPTNWRPRAVGSVATACFMLAWSWLPLSGRHFLMMNDPCRSGWGATPSFLPHDLPAFLRGIGFKGQVLNSDYLGGFYLYHFYPHAVPLTDSRYEVCTPETLRSIHSALGPGGDWRALVARYDIRGVLLGHADVGSHSMLSSLAGADDWRLVYLDHAASFWMPNTVASLPPAIDLSIPPCPRVNDAMQVASFLTEVGAKPLLAVHLERSLRFRQETEWFLHHLAGVQIELERFAAAGHSLKRLLELDPNNAVALNRKAFLACRRGDLPEALRLVERALEIEPDDEAILRNRRRVQQALRGRPSVGRPRNDARGGDSP